MEFKATEDINAPIEQVFAILSDVDIIERQALRRGIDVRRRTEHTSPAVGMAWDATFRFRGRNRNTGIELTRFEPPEAMTFVSTTQGLGATFVVELVALSRTQTRVSSHASVSPKTLSARLLVQSMKLAKSKLQRRFSVRMAQFAKDVEERATKLA